MVKLRGRNEIPERSERDPDIGMEKDRLGRRNNKIASEHFSSETKEDQWNDCACFRKNLVERMKPARGQRIELLAAMVHSMESP